MTKLVYPVEGIYDSSSSALIDSIAKKILTASVDCSFDSNCSDCSCTIQSRR